MKKKVAGLILLIMVMAVIGGVYLYQGKQKKTVADGYLGGEKIGLLEDEEVRDILAKKYNLDVSYSKAGSLDMVTADLNGKDYLFPSSNIALEYYEDMHGKPAQSEIIFNTPIVIYSHRPIVEALEREGLVTKEGEVSYIDMNKLVELIESDTRWADIGVNELYGRISVDTTDPSKSNSGNMFAALLGNVLNGGETLTEQDVLQVLPKLQGIFNKLGYMETSSADLFNQFLKLGVGAKPLVVGYESQLIEYAAQNPEDYEKIKEDIVVLYPTPTVWSSHVMIALDDDGKQFLNALQDEEIQKLAWIKHGFRTGSAGVASDMEKLNKGERKMAEITLADLKEKKEPVQKAENASETGWMEQAVPELTPQEREKVEALKAQIDVTDSQMLMQFGAGAKQNIADFSANILNNVRSKDTGYVGDLMTDLIVKVQGLDFDSLEHETGLKGLFKKAESKVKKFIAQYETLEVQIDNIEGKLDEARMEMLKDIGMFDVLYEKNLEYFKQLQLFIVAGEEKIKELNEKTIPALRKEAENSEDPMNAQIVRDFENTVAQFEKKVYDLKTSKTIALQMAPQIKLIQNNDKILADKIQTAITETIPLWKSQMVMALGLYKQQEALKLQRDITDTTNALLVKNSEKLKQNTIEVTKESERSIVDVETLKKANENLILTINETVKIQKEGREKRAAAETELIKIENEIKQTLLNV